MILLQLLCTPVPVTRLGTSHSTDTHTDTRGPAETRAQQTDSDRRKDPCLSPLGFPGVKNVLEASAFSYLAHECRQHMPTKSRKQSLPPIKCSLPRSAPTGLPSTLSLRDACPQSETSTRNTASRAPGIPFPQLIEGPHEMQTSQLRRAHSEQGNDTTTSTQGHPEFPPS